MAEANAVTPECSQCQIEGSKVAASDRLLAASKYVYVYDEVSISRQREKSSKFNAFNDILLVRLPLSPDVPGRPNLTHGISLQRDGTGCLVENCTLSPYIRGTDSIF